MNTGKKIILKRAYLGPKLPSETKQKFKRQPPLSMAESQKSPAQKKRGRWRIKINRDEWGDIEIMDVFPVGDD